MAAFLVQSAEGAAAGAKADANFNQDEAKRAGLTMQAALFERKAATAAAKVEHFKVKRDLKNAHIQLNLEKKYWKKSQSLVLKAALAHPLPNAQVAKAAVQAKVATEAARAMKELAAKEKDPTEKALDEKVLKIELGNAKTALEIVADVEKDLKTIPEELAIHKQAEARLLSMKKAQAAAQAKSDHYLALYKAAPEGKKKISYAKKEFAAAQKVADIDVEMKVIDNMDIQANKKLFHEYSTVESTAVGKAKITAAKESAEEKQQFTVERNDLAKEGIAYERRSANFADIEALKKELGKGVVAKAEKEMAAKKASAQAWAKKVDASATQQTNPMVYAGCAAALLVGGGAAFALKPKPSQAGYESVSQAGQSEEMA